MSDPVINPSITDRGSSAWRAAIGALAVALVVLFVSVRSYVTFRLDEQNLQEPPRSFGAPVFLPGASGGQVFVLSGRWQTYRGPRRLNPSPERVELHVDLWAFDAVDARHRWHRRVLSERNGAMSDKVLLGIDGETVWIYANGLRALRASDGAPIADAAKIEARNQQLAGRLVGEARYYGFDHNGVHLTDADARSWRIDARDFGARPVETSAVAARADVARPAYFQSSATTSFQSRGMNIGSNWLGVLTDEEAAKLGSPAVVPGAEPGERRGAAAWLLDSLNIPDNLDAPKLQRYRLWRARIDQVSRAPADWPKEMPDNWGMRPRYSGYAVLAEAPDFLAAGLLDRGEDNMPVWLREPDSVLILHRDRLGEEGRLQLSRVAGPGGRIVWTATLPMSVLQAVMGDEKSLTLFGREYVPEVIRPHASRRGDPYHDASEQIVSIDLATGKLGSYNLTVDGRAALLKDAGVN